MYVCAVMHKLYVDPRCDIALAPRRAFYHRKTGELVATAKDDVALVYCPYMGQCVSGRMAVVN